MKDCKSFLITKFFLLVFSLNGISQIEVKTDTLVYYLVVQKWKNSNVYEDLEYIVNKSDKELFWIPGLEGAYLCGQGGMADSIDFESLGKFQTYSFKRAKKIVKKSLELDKGDKYWKIFEISIYGRYSEIECDNRYGKTLFFYEIIWFDKNFGNSYDFENLKILLLDN